MRHRFHALCPYFATFPEMFAEYWLNRYSSPGDLVIDPFCGRGTVPLTALLMGRRAIANDINRVAYCITKAKVHAPELGSIQDRLSELESECSALSITDRSKLTAGLPRFFKGAFAKRTLIQVCFLRDRLDWENTDIDCMIAALALGSLHGESHRSPAYFSARMPRTISTKPAYSLNYWSKNGILPPLIDVFDVLRARAELRYTSGRPTGACQVYNADVRTLPKTLKGNAEFPVMMITSPPYPNVTNYEEDQWLRMWFLGGEVTPGRNRISRDDRHYSVGGYISFMKDTWRSIAMLMGRDAIVVMRLGAVSMRPHELAGLMRDAAQRCGRKVAILEYHESKIQQSQTTTVNVNAKGCKTEVDCLFRMA